jgi:hypothetical protein
MATKRTPRGRKRVVPPAPRHRAPPPREQLLDVVRNLQLAMAAVMVCVEALRRQNADLDADVALVLERDASDRLHTEIERIRRLLA